MATPTATGTYVRTQATAAGLINLVLNPAIDWLTARHRPAQPVWGVEGLVINFAVTSVILSTLVGAFAAWGVRREARAGRLDLTGAPRPGWLTGFGLGAMAAALVVAVAWLLHTVGITTASLWWLLASKAVFAGTLGFLVARRVIRAQLQ